MKNKISPIALTLLGVFALSVMIFVWGVRAVNKQNSYQFSVDLLTQDKVRVKENNTKQSITCSPDSIIEAMTFLNDPDYER